MEGITPLHLILVLVIAVIVLGPGKLPDVGRALGESIREFRKATGDLKEPIHIEAGPAGVDAATTEPPRAPEAGPQV